MKTKIIILVVGLVFLLFAGLGIVLLLDVDVTNCCQTKKSAQEEIAKFKASLPSKEDNDATNRQAWREHLQWSDSCEEEFIDIPVFIEVDSLQFHSLSTDEDLVQVQCAMGAYQGNYEFVYFNAATREVKQLQFDNYYKTEGEVTQKTESLVCGDPIYDEGKLQSFCRGRGLGDCGTFSRYEFDQDNKVFITNEIKYKEDCDGQIDSEFVEGWETLYP